jgi:hypothetical protein
MDNPCHRLDCIFQFNVAGKQADTEDVGSFRLAHPVACRLFLSKHECVGTRLAVEKKSFGVYRGYFALLFSALFCITINYSVI